MPVHVLRARAVDDFILFDQLLLHTLGGLNKRAAFTRDVLVKVSVSVSAWPLLKACVQRVRMRPGEQGGRSNDRLDTGQ